MQTQTCLIAEVGMAHDGSLGRAEAYIDAAADAGADVVKFQTHIADAESSEFEPFRVAFSKQDKSRIAYWRRTAFSVDQWSVLKKKCDSRGVEFMSSPFSCYAVDLLEKIGVRRYKIASGEISNLLMIEKIASTGKEIILSSGMSSLEELDKAVNLISQFGNSYAVLQCTTQYPVSANEIGLNVIAEVRERYGCRTGLSDHSGTIFAGLAAATLGAEILEVHVVFDTAEFGPDVSSSITFSNLKTLKEGLKFINVAMSANGVVDKSDLTQYKELRRIFNKALSLSRDMKRGLVISAGDLESKKPADKGIPASDYNSIIGNRLKKDIKKGDFLQYDDIQS